MYRDNKEELFPIVDDKGQIISSATRGECHSGSMLLHPVVHLHVFNSKGELFLQKRPAWKDIQPGKWDTAIGGHVDLGENVETALKRETREELGITDFDYEKMGSYVFQSKRERELVFVHKTVYDGEVKPSQEELDGGRFWGKDEIKGKLGKDVFTPNFECEYKKFFMTVIAMLMIFLSVPGCIYATDVPSISPSITFSTKDGDIIGTDTTASAPLIATFHANVSNLGSYTGYYEWRFYVPGNENNPYLIRYTEDTDYTFTTSGSSYIVLYATFVNGKDTVAYTSDYWKETTPLKVTISESKLEVPNAFSPNGDGINDIFKVKSGYQSLTDFHAYIFNRWGQKIYEWTDPSQGWDGTYNGHDAKQGVYFVLVKAKGADGINYNIKRDVNLLRGYSESGKSSSTTDYN